MPLLDHFHPPLYPRQRWESFFANWATRLADALMERVSREFHVGEPLPLLPLRLTGDLFIPVDCEAAYQEACRRRRLD